MPYFGSAIRRGLTLLAVVLLGRPAAPAIAQAQPQPVRWSLRSGLLISRLRYPSMHQRNGSSEVGTDYVLGRHQPQSGAAAGIEAALPVPPVSTTTFLVLSAQAAYNRRSVAVHAAPYGPAPMPPPAYDAHFRYRTVDAQVGLVVRHYLAPRRLMFWEAGPVFALTCQDYSRVDTQGLSRYTAAPASNVLLRATWGLRMPGRAARWQLAAGYARGIATRRTQVVTSEDFAELTMHYQLVPH